jgi:hypothetical protein
VLGGLCLISATLDAQGEVQHLNDMHGLVFGELDATSSDRVTAIEKAMSGARFDARVSTQMRQEMWEKWVFITSLASATCLLRGSVGDIVAAGQADIALTLQAECNAIAAAHGYAPRGTGTAHTHADHPRLADHRINAERPGTRRRHRSGPHRRRHAGARPAAQFAYAENRVCPPENLRSTPRTQRHNQGDTVSTPAFPAEWQPLVDQAATALRTLALDETAKEKFCNDPLLRPYMHKVSQRYVAGQTVEEALQRVEQIIARGHAASAEYMGESVRDEAFAMAETAVFMQLVQAIGQRNLNCSISFDLSHVGSLVDSELGYRNARRIAQAAAEINREVMISMEGIDRSDDIYRIYTRLHQEDDLRNVGITVPAKRHRTEQDLLALMKLPGRIRLVKGAFLEPEGVAYSRGTRTGCRLPPPRANAAAERPQMLDRHARPQHPVRPQRLDPPRTHRPAGSSLNP